MKDYLISIVVPVYNVEQYLDRCLMSLTNQTYQNIEIILVDDGSTDQSASMCDAWCKKDERIRVLHKKNGGLGSARNEGIKNANGDYIGFVDSDDWVSPNMYQKLLSLCIEYSADISCCGIKYTSSEYIVGDNSKEVVKAYSQEEYARQYFKVSSNETIHYAVNKLYCREIGKKIIYPEGLIDEDVEGFAYALVNSKLIVTTNVVMYYYWQNVNGISYKWFTNKQLDLLHVWENVVNICKIQKPEWTEYAELNRKRAYFGLLSRLALNEAREDANYSEIEKDLLNNLKKYRNDLLQSKMPISRKVVLICMCYNYQLTKKIIRFVKNTYHHKE